VFSDLHIERELDIESLPEYVPSMYKLLQCIRVLEVDVIDGAASDMKIQISTFFYVVGTVSSFIE